MYHLPLEKLLGGDCSGWRSRRAGRGMTEEALGVDGEPQGEWWPSVGVERREELGSGWGRQLGYFPHPGPEPVLIFST
jgi:hypothetical protein